MVAINLNRYLAFQNKLTIILLSGLLISMIGGCKKKTEVNNYEDLKAYVNNPEHGFIKTWKRKEIEVVCTINPGVLLAAQDIFVRQYGQKEQLDSLADKYTQNTYFTLTLSKDNQEFENQYLYNRQLYTKVIQYFNSTISEDIYLITPSGSKIYPISAIYPRMYGTTKGSSILITFDYKLPYGGNIDFVFESHNIELPPIKFTYFTNELKQVPKLIL